MNRASVFLLTSLISASSLYAQQYYRMKVNINAQLRSELLEKADRLFTPSPQFQYTISPEDVATLPDNAANRYNEVFLKALDSAQAKEPANARILYEYGNYYDFHGYAAKAKLYYMKAYQNLYPVYFNQDTARLLAIRGVIEQKLGIGDAAADLEEALRFNPLDSLALSTYLTILTDRQDYKKAKEVCSTAMSGKPASPAFIYIRFGIAQIMESYLPRLKQLSDETEREKTGKADYENIVDLEQVDRYAQNYGNNPEMVNARVLLDVFGLSIKMLFFESDDTGNVKFAFTPKDITRLVKSRTALQQQYAKGQINAFSANKNMGIVCFMLHDWDSAIIYLDKALRTFPGKLGQLSFNTAGVYDVLLNIYKSTSRKKFGATLAEKINKEPEGHKSLDDHILAARYFIMAKNYYRAEEWAVKALAMDSASFEIYSLLTHIAFRLDKPDQVNYYAQCALRCPAPSTSDQYRFVMLFSLYYLSSGNAPSAYSNLQAARGLSPEAKCQACDELEEQFIEVTAK